jgi:hypothetical protein
LGLGGVQAHKSTGDFFVELLEDGVHSGTTTVHRFHGDVTPHRKLLELGQGFARCLYIQAVRVELQVGVELSDGLVALLHLLGDSGEGEVGVWIVGLNLHCVFGAKIGGVQIAPVLVEFSDCEVFGGSIFRSLNLFDLGKFPAGQFCVGVICRGCGFRVVIGTAGVVTGTTRAA